MRICIYKDRARAVFSILKKNFFLETTRLHWRQLLNWRANKKKQQQQQQQTRNLFFKFSLSLSFFFLEIIESTHLIARNKCDVSLTFHVCVCVCCCTNKTEKQSRKKTNLNGANIIGRHGRDNIERRSPLCVIGLLVMYINWWRKDRWASWIGGLAQFFFSKKKETKILYSRSFFVLPFVKSMYTTTTKEMYTVAALHSHTQAVCTIPFVVVVCYKSRARARSAHVRLCRDAFAFYFIFIFLVKPSIITKTFIQKPSKKMIN